MIDQWESLNHEPDNVIGRRHTTTWYQCADGPWIWHSTVFLVAGGSILAEIHQN